MMQRWRSLRESTAAASMPALMRSEGADAADADDVEAMAEESGEQVECPTCHGSGKIRGGNLTCPECKGSGEVSAESLQESAACAVCGVAQADHQWGPLSEKDYSTETRVAMAKRGQAIPIKDDQGEVTGGAFPIADKGDLHDAVQAFGRSPSAQTKAHIIKNAQKLGATDLLPADWTGQTKEAGGLNERVAELEKQLGLEAKLREAKPAVLNTTFSTPLRVQAASGQEGYRVVLIREGKGNQEDDNWYTAAAIRELCESGVAEGMQAYANHPSLDEEEIRPERDVKQLVGSYQDVTFKESGGPVRAEAIFVPLTTDETHPTYGWVITLAEAAARNTAPQPLAGISLYGLSAGDTGARPDGSQGRIVSMIRPTSGDIVTNAGAGGGFIKQMWESARAFRRLSTERKEAAPMKVADLQDKIKEAAARLREAETDEAREAIAAELDALQTAEVDAPPKPVDTVEALTEAAPKLVEQIREAAKQEAGEGDAEGLRKQLREAQAALTQFTDVMSIAETLREAGITDEVEQRYFVAQARARGLRESADVKDLIETERAYQKKQEDALWAKFQETTDLPDVEGVFARVPEDERGDGGLGWLREAGIPVKDAA